MALVKGKLKTGEQVEILESVYFEDDIRFPAKFHRVKVGREIRSVPISEVTIESIDGFSIKEKIT